MLLFYLAVIVASLAGDVVFPPSPPEVISAQLLARGITTRLSFLLSKICPVLGVRSLPKDPHLHPSQIAW